MVGNIVGKRENAGYQYFLSFPTMFSMTLKVRIVWDRLTLNQTTKLLDLSKLKAFAGDKLNLAEKLKFLLGKLENIVGKGENAGFQQFLLFQQCFQNASISVSSKVGILWDKILASWRSIDPGQYFTVGTFCSWSIFTCNNLVDVVPTPNLVCIKMASSRNYMCQSHDPEHGIKIRDQRDVKRHSAGTVLSNFRRKSRSRSDCIECAV